MILERKCKTARDGAYGRVLHLFGRRHRLTWVETLTCRPVVNIVGRNGETEVLHLSLGIAIQEFLRHSVAEVDIVQAQERSTHVVSVYIS